MMLSDYFYSEMILIYIDIRVGFHRTYKTFLNLETGIVGMMQNTEFTVTAFAVQIE